MTCRMLGIVLVSLLMATLSPAADPPQSILHSGRIYTADAGDTVVEAMAIRDGRILAIGSNAEVRMLSGEQTQQIDLAGKFVAPGLIDSHVHAGGAAMFEFDHDVPDMETIPDVLDYVRQRAAVVPEGDWIVLQQVFITRLKEQRYPTKSELDEAAPKHPVVFRTGPDAAVNTLALQKCGIDREFAAQHPANVQVEKSTGEPTGVLRQSSSVLKDVSTSVGKKATEQDRIDRLAELLQDYNSVGITGAIDRNCSDSAQGDYERLEREGRLTVRMRLSRAFSATRSIEEVTKDLDQIAADPLFTAGSDRLKIIGVKAFLDGGMLTGSAYMSQPWGVSTIYSIDDPAYRGMRYIPVEQLIPAVKACAERNLAFTAHSVGDAAVAGLLDAYEAVNRDVPIGPTHSTITHSNFMSAESVRRCAELGVGVDIQPAWLYLDTHTLAAQFGEDRLRYFQPLASLFAARVPAGGGSDHMQKVGSLRSINPYDPFLGMWTAITRNSRYYDHPLHPEEALTRTQALRFYTINNAWLMRAEDRLGSLEPGKLADFIIVDRDLLKCPVDDLRWATVLMTYVGGETVFDSEELAASLNNATGARSLTRANREPLPDPAIDIEIVHAGEFKDGGTCYVHLRHETGKERWFGVTTDSEYLSFPKNRVYEGSQLPTAKNIQWVPVGSDRELELIRELEQALAPYQTRAAKRVREMLRTESAFERQWSLNCAEQVLRRLYKVTGREPTKQP